MKCADSPEPGPAPHRAMFVEGSWVRAVIATPA